MTVKVFLDGLLSFNGPPIFVLGMLLTAVVAVMAIWAMWPSIWTELGPFRLLPTRKPPRSRASGRVTGLRQGSG